MIYDCNLQIWVFRMNSNIYQSHTCCDIDTQTVKSVLANCLHCSCTCTRSTGIIIRHNKHNKKRQQQNEAPWTENHGPACPRSTGASTPVGCQHSRSQNQRKRPLRTRDPCTLDTPSSAALQPGTQ